MRIVVTGGGTAGHVTPIKPVIDEIKLLDPDVKFLFIAQKGDRFADLLKLGEDIDQISYINAGRYRRYPNESFLQRATDLPTMLLNARDLFRSITALFKAFFILRRFKPDAVFGNGGFVSVPVGYASKMLKVPLLIHESDSIPGIANRMLSRVAQTIAFGMPSKVTTMHGKTTDFVGIPLREAFVKRDSRSKEAIKKSLGLDKERSLISISGGSLGAAAINNAIIAGLPELLSTMQIVHITGEDNLSDVTTAVGALNIDISHYHPLAFTDDIASYFKASDLVVTRASATTFSELSALHKPTILIPAKQLLDQRHNAAQVAKQGAAIVQDEVELEDNKELLPELIKKLLNDPKQLRSLEEGSAALAKPDAAKELAKMIHGLAT